MTIDIKQRDEGNVKVLELFGEFDSAAVPFFTSEFGQISGMCPGGNFVADLSGLEFISSAGWTAFVNECKELREKNGDLRFAAMRENSKKIYGLVGVDEYIKNYETAEEAVRSYEKE